MIFGKHISKNETDPIKLHMIAGDEFEGP
jgi:hypothetical protein